MRLLFLPPYSPDFDPIKEDLSAMKAWLRRNCNYVLGELTGDAYCNPLAILWRAVYESMTPENINGWFHNSGYVV
jgi:transposase